MRKSKRGRARTLIIIASFGLVVFVVLMIGGVRLTISNSEKLDEEILNQVVINSPNVTLGSRIKADTGMFKGQFIYKQHKDIDGYIIPWSDIIGNYGIWNADSVGRAQLNNSNGILDFVEGTGQKMMKFYKQEVSYKVLSNDVAQVSLETNRVMEMAISFDQKYTLAEIQTKVPTNLNVAWLWLDEKNNAGQVEALTPDLVYGFDGIQKQNEQVTDDKVLEGNYNNFISSLEMLAEESDEIDALFTKYSKQNLKQVRFKGIILTGQEKNFYSLASATFIRASEIGAVAEIIPYITPYK
ncbi:hypothetical protein HB848_01625 [Listeria rocourtiae]|uniref:anti sigma factor C-terminal domain-containing protein n=1 Tax=Listeria rocourtiae TaxID=647910 RepID=UPI001626D661|nr:anti sigma factor C-terminal domain-containing protein [Listeria rocourtiae]MBC1434037.1 hypothetical protein [Listeria rocourtiae]